MAETDAQREARYFAGYEAVPDGADEDVKAIPRLAIENLRDSGTARAKSARIAEKKVRYRVG